VAPQHRDGTVPASAAARTLQRSMDDPGQLTIAETEPIEAAFRRLNANRRGIVFAVDGNGRVVGCLTDGDIRRHLLKHRDLSQPIAACVNRNFVSVRLDTAREQILKLLDHRIHIVPMLDAEGRLVETYSRERFRIEEEREFFSRARSPARLSFAGGGTDLTTYFYEHGGIVINAAITLYAHATLRRRADRRVHIYSHDFRTTVEAASVSCLTLDGKLDLIKSAVRLIDPPYGFDLEVAADFPVGSGLGGSAVVSSAIFGCFNEFRSDRWDRHQIAELAFQSERLMLNIPGGWQDQYATVFGGVNLMEFNSEHNDIQPLRLEQSVLRELEASLVLVYTGRTHDSGRVHAGSRTRQNDPLHAALAERQKQLTREIKKHLLRGRLLEYGRLLNDAWAAKRTLTPGATDSGLDRIYELALANRAVGGKILGAGGGGYFLFYVAPFHRYQLSAAMEQEGYHCERISFDETGLVSWKTRLAP
jgi:D-glycero-alpha-D-manno-heptose-7-phosphate kinase